MKCFGYRFLCVCVWFRFLWGWPTSLYLIRGMVICCPTSVSHPCLAYEPKTLEFSVMNKNPRPSQFNSDIFVLAFWCGILIRTFTPLEALSLLLGTSLVAQMVRSLPAMWETWVWSLGWEDPLEKEMATYSSILAWKIPWTEEHGRLHSMGSQRPKYDSAASLSLSFNLLLPLLAIYC